MKTNRRKLLTGTIALIVVTTLCVSPIFAQGMGMVGGMGGMSMGMGGMGGQYDESARPTQRVTANSQGRRRPEKDSVKVTNDALEAVRHVLATE